MTGRKLAAALALAATIGAISTPAASGGSRANTEVILDGILYNATTGRTEFNGRVESPRKDCENKRKIIVFRKADGPDVKVGAKKSAKDGSLYRWFITDGGIAPDGDYYAKAEAGDTCKGDKSNTVIWD